jgi:hypothetical protein
MIGQNKSVKIACTTVVLALMLSACGQPPKQKPIAPVSTPHDFYDGLTANERNVAETSRQEALESQLSQQSLEWQSTQSSTAGNIRPIRTFKIASGQYCREFEERLTGITKWDRVRRAVACRREGQWILVENS